MAVVVETLGILTQDEGDTLRAKALATDINELPTGYYHSARIVGTFMGMGTSLIGTFFAFQGSAAAVASINADIGPSPNTSLPSTVWTVFSSISLLLFGRLSDRFGRRNFLLGANLIGIVGAIIACTAQSYDALIGGQVLLGLASGPPAAYPLAAGELMSNKTKFLGAVCVALPNIIATGFGSYIGIRLGLQASWRWIFYIYVIIMVVSTALLFSFYYPPSFVQLHGKKTRKRDEIKKADFIGIFLLTGGLALFLLGISWGGSVYRPWDSPAIIGLLVSGGVMCIAFITYECFGKVERPIIPMRFFRDVRGFGCLTIISSVMGIMNTALFIMYPQQITYIFGSTLHTWEETAWMSSTAAFGIWGGIVILGSLFHIIRHIRWQLTLGCVWVTAFLGAMASVNRNTKSSAIVFSVFTGFACGWEEVTAMLVVQFLVSDEDMGIAFAVVSASRSIFGAIFTAAFVALYTNKVPGELQSKLIPAVLDAGLPQSSLGELLIAVASGNQQTIAAVSGMNATLITVTNDAVADSYAAAYAYVYYFAMGLGCISIIAAASSRDFDRYLNDHVPHQIYHKKESGVDPLDTCSSDETTSPAGIDSEK